jgi:hypothetical protein
MGGSFLALPSVNLLMLVSCAEIFSNDISPPNIQMNNAYNILIRSTVGKDMSKIALTIN